MSRNMEISRARVVSTTCSQPRLLYRRILVFRRSVTPQQLRKILRERGTGQDHVAPHLVSLLLQIALHVRQESDDRGSLLELRLQFGDERQRLGVGVVEVEGDQRGLRFAVL